MKKRNGNRDKVNLGMAEKALIAAAVFLLAVCAAVSLRGQIDERKAHAKEGYFQEKEEELKQTVRDYLEENGFSNSGIMLTRIVREDGSRTYTLTIHHERIECMDEERRQILAGELLDLCFQDDGCTFQSKFL